MYPALRASSSAISTSLHRARCLASSFAPSGSAHLYVGRPRCYSSRNPPRVFNEGNVFQTEELAHRALNANVLRLVEAYRRYGHYNADLDPLGLCIRNKVPQLDTMQYGLQDATATFDTKAILNIDKEQPVSLAQIVRHLEKAYCGKIGVQFNHIESESERRWLYGEIERIASQSLSKEEKIKTHRLLVLSETFDHFMHKRFPAVKRYGLEGAESMMPLMNEVFSEGAKVGVQDIVVGMPHRGRLNLLVDLLEFAPRNVFWKVNGQSELPPDVLGIGDVLSHFGTSVALNNYGSALRVSLIHNPSHLEAVNPVAMGKIRAKQADVGDLRGEKAMCVLLHGDAAFAGQGVVAESLALSHLPGFGIGGTVHVIVNNQLGFTTTPHLGRSSHYSADMAKMIGCPTIHVNADSPEDVIKATRVALAYRHKFQRDVVIDLIGYRRHGHNEVDEPAFTQPVMYRIVRARASIAALYGKQLVTEGVLTADETAKIAEQEMQRLDGELKATANFQHAQADQLRGKWEGLVQSAKAVVSPETGVKLETLKEIAIKSVEHPNVNVHQRLERSHCLARQDKINKNQPVDWGTAEALAVGSLLAEGLNVRLSGQDVGRGTFSQRHFELVDQDSELLHVPLNHLYPAKQGKLEVVNSNLSEMAVLCYEYGYSIEDPKNLVIWEAQFGDFANGAQISIDQFIVSGEAKWLRQSGIVLLLPHGYDGTGPEHSSARIERFLQLSDVEGVDVGNKAAFNRNPNMHIINPSTPANYFHALRRQMHRNFRKPLVVISPKILLRLNAAVSPLSHMQVGTHFQPVLLDDDASIIPSSVERVMFCSGKIYYDLVEERKKNKMTNTTFIRLEELSPFPLEKIEKAIRNYPSAKKYYWVQEESQNAGAWSFVQPRFDYLMQQANSKLIYVGRPPLAASAVGVSTAHKKEVETLMKDAFSK